MISIAAGVQYAIVVNYEGAPPPGAGQSQGIWGGAVGDRYAGGALCLSALDGISWNCGSGDVHFQTYVDLAPAGFNVNPLVTFAPIASTYRTVTNTVGCPAGFVGKFTFTARLTNKSSSPAMPGLDVIVQTLTNGNVLLDSQTKQILGGAGAVMELPLVGQYGDGLLSASEAVDVPFIICLKTRQSFQFFVDVFGIVTKLVSVNRTGTAGGNRSSYGAVLSADGRFVAFGSDASDLVAINANALTNVFVRDLQTGITKLVSVNRTGVQGGNGYSGVTAISGDGRFIAFWSIASDLVENDTNGASDVFVRDMHTGVTKLVSINRTETASGNGDSGYTLPNFPQPAMQEPVLSADGRLVVFGSAASDLVENDTNGKPDLFVRDLQTGVTTLVSVNRTGSDSGHGGNPVEPSRFGAVLSTNGRFVAFVSDSTDLVAIDGNSAPDVFVRDLQTGTTSLVSVNRLGTDSGHGDFESNSGGPMISADGRFVAFNSAACDLVEITEQDCFEVDKYDVFVRDLQTGTTTLVNVNESGTRRIFALFFLTGLSTDGRLVTFGKAFVFPGPSDHVALFVRDLETDLTSLVSVNRTGTNNGNGESSHDALSADVRFVAFTSTASDLVANDTNGVSDVFVRPLP